KVHAGSNREPPPHEFPTSRRESAARETGGAFAAFFWCGKFFINHLLPINRIQPRLTDVALRRLCQTAVTASPEKRAELSRRLKENSCAGIFLSVLVRPLMRGAM
ncbi:MAG: hypothetical protein K2O14_00230, partial [Oscillospiraceae bacterium]|nr:hypothetical protein [Oscillospiraceae bacterium]